MPNVLFLEDLKPRQRFHSPDREITADRAGLFGSRQSIASEMHVASLTMRLIVESNFRPAGGLLGAGIKDMSWPTQTTIGDLLHVESEVLDVRRSKSRPDRGLARIRNVTLNAAQETVQIMTSTVVVRARE